eukprot:scaffold58161_cov58-Phaeocystis_antarctica.AAC.4
MVCHGREAYVQHLEALEALERLDLVVEEDQPHEEEEEAATVYKRAGHAARAHHARGGGEGEVTAAVADVALLAECPGGPLAAAEVCHKLSHRGAGGGARLVGAVVGAAADLGGATRVPIEARHHYGLEASGGGAAGRAIRPGGARRAAGVLAAVGVVVALAAGARPPAGRALFRHGVLGARLARALIGLASLIVVRVPRASDSNAGGAPGA